MKKVAVDKNLAVGYCRFSSDNQRDESIDSQKRNIIAYAKRENYHIVGWFIDKAETGTSTEKRDEFKKMVEQAKRGKFKFVLVNKLDRFSRNKWGSQFYKFELSKSGVLVKSATEPIDNSPAGKMMEAMLEGMAQFYSDNLAQEVKRGMNENAYNGVFNGGTIPFGYKKVQRINKKTGAVEYSKKGAPLSDIAICEHDSEGVRIIFDRLLAGKKHYEIIDELTAKGFRSRTGNKFQDSSLENILRNEKYMGTYTFNKKKTKMEFDGRKRQVKNDIAGDVIRVPDGVPAIISKETFEAVQKLMDLRKYKTGRTVDEYLLIGKIKCGECGDTYRGGRKYNPNKDTHYQYYVCQAPRSCRDTGRVFEGDERCRNHTVGRTQVEKFVMSEIKELVFNVTNIDGVMEMYNRYISQTTDNNDAIIRRLELQLQDIERKIDIAIDKIMMEEDETMAKKMRDRVTAFEREKDDLKNRLEIEHEQKSQVRVSAKDFKRAFEKARELLAKGDYNSKKRILDMFLNKVVVFNDRIEVYNNILPNFILGALRTDIDIKVIANWASIDNLCLFTNNITVLDEKRADEDSFSCPDSLLTKQVGSPGRI